MNIAPDFKERQGRLTDSFSLAIFGLSFMLNSACWLVNSSLNGQFIHRVSTALR